MRNPIIIAIDGIDASGKTTFAKLLHDEIEKSYVLPIETFHYKNRFIKQQGENSPEGYYYDSFDYNAIKSSLLIPLGPKGNGKYVVAKFDFRRESMVKVPVSFAKPNSILLFDGVFLLRPELYNYWDFSIFIDVDLYIS